MQTLDKREGKLSYFRAGLIFGPKEVSLICGSAQGISKEKKKEKKKKL